MYKIHRRIYRYLELEYQVISLKLKRINGRRHGDSFGLIPLKKCVNSRDTWNFLFQVFYLLLLLNYGFHEYKYS